MHRRISALLCAAALAAAATLAIPAEAGASTVNAVTAAPHGKCGTGSSGWGGWWPGLFFGVFGWNCNL